MFGKVGQDFVLDSIGEESIIRISAQAFKGQDRNAFLRRLCFIHFARGLPLGMSRRASELLGRSRITQLGTVEVYDAKPGAVFHLDFIDVM